MAPAKQGSRQSKGKDIIVDLGEENHTKMVSEPGEGGMSSSSNSEECAQIRRVQYQLLAAISNLSAKLDLLLQSRSDALGHREEIGTSNVRVSAIGIDVHDYVQGINTNLQQQEQTWSSGSRRPQLLGIRGNPHLEEISSGGRQQQGLPSMEVPTMFPGGRLQQGIPRSGMEHVRPNAQEGFQQPAPNEDCSKLMDCCYKGILDNREGIGTSRVYANGGNVNDQVHSNSRNSHWEDQAATTTNSHLLFQQQPQNRGQQQIGFEEMQLQLSSQPGFPMSQQQQQLTQFSQGMTMSQLLQNSDDFPPNEQRFMSQERDLSLRKRSSIQPISFAREDSQIPMSRTSTNVARRWNSTPGPDEKCHVNEEVGCRIGLMETSISRLGMILDSVQSDVMQVNRLVKKVVLGNEGLQQKLVMQDKTLLQTVKVKEDFMNRYGASISAGDPHPLADDDDGGFDFGYGEGSRKSEPTEHVKRKKAKWSNSVKVTGNRSDLSRTKPSQHGYRVADDLTGDPYDSAVRNRKWKSVGNFKPSTMASEPKSRFLHNFRSSGDFDFGTLPSKKKSLKLDKLDFNFNGPGIAAVDVKKLKDLFSEFYWKKLARRLLFDRSANDVHHTCLEGASCSEAGAGDGKSSASSDVLSSDTSNEEKSHSSSEEEGDSSPTLGWPAEKSIGDGSCDGGEGEEKAVEAVEKESSKISEIEMMKERFSKLLLGKDMSGCGNGVSTALTISNAITNLCATLFGQLWRLEPLPSDKKIMWRREMEWLLCVADHIVELIPSCQTFPDGTKLEIMTCRPRSDMCINLPALRKLDNLLLEILDSFNNAEFWYVDQGVSAPESDNSASFRKHTQSQEEKWWLPVPRVPCGGLQENTRKHLQHKSECANQILKAAMAINSNSLAEMEIPDSYLESLPKNGRASLGDVIYRYITSEQFSSECLRDCLDFSSEHQALEVGNRVEASVYVWRRRAINRPVSCANRTNTKSSWAMMKELMADAEKRKLLADRAESLLLCLKQRFPGLPQTTLDMSKIQYNKDVGCIKDTCGTKVCATSAVEPNCVLWKRGTKVCL